MSALLFAPRQPPTSWTPKLLEAPQRGANSGCHPPPQPPVYTQFSEATSTKKKKKKQLPAGVFQAEEGEPKVLVGLKRTQSRFGGARVLPAQ